MTITRQIPFGRPWLTEQDREAVLQVLQGHILTHGPVGREFEHAFSKFIGVEGASISVSSCMAALHLAYFQMGLEPGDQVIVPAQTHVATAHAVELMGAQPIFVDCELETGNIDPTKIETLITPRTKALSLVHFLGIPCNMDEIMTIANNHNLKVVEDCALAVGASYKEKHVGLFGDVGCFSFYPVKHMTTGEGGMFVSRHPAVVENVAKLRAFGVDRTYSERTTPGMYDVPILGLNYRMSEIQAALGVQQLAKINKVFKQRRSNFLSLKSLLSEIENILILDAVETGTVSSYYCLSVVLLGKLAKYRNQLIARLKEAGIGTSIYYPQPVPRMTYYRQKYGYNAADYPNAVAISDHSIALPVGPHVSKADIEYIAKQFKRCLNQISV